VNLTQKVLWNTAAQLGGKLVMLAAMLLSVRLTTSYLGVERFGEYAIVLALTPVVLVVADLGLSLLLARELAKTPERRDELASTMLAFRLAGSGLVVALAGAAVPFLPYDRDVKVGLLVALGGVFTLSAASFATPFFQVALRLDLAALVDGATALASLAAIVVATQLDLGFLAVVAALPIAYFVSLLLSAVLLRRFWRPRLRIDRPLARRLLRAAVSIAAVTVISLLHFRIDSVLLSLLKPASDVGIYAVAFRFLEWALILPGLFMAAVFPLLAGALTRTGDEVQLVIERAFNFLLLLAVPLALAFAILAGPIVELVAPNGFDAAVTPLRILAVALVFAFGNAIFANLLLALDRQASLLAVSAAGLALNVGLNLVAIPRWSYTGAAATTVVTEALGALVVFWLARRAYAFSLRPSFVARLVCAAAVMTGILLLVDAYPLPLAVGAAGATFAAAAYAFRVVTRTDVRIVLGRY
jgi:O-antigen/teichoic acid export membrane protein